MYPDGGGLYLQVTTGGASWVYRYMLDGRAREMGLGPLPVTAYRKRARRRWLPAFVTKVSSPSRRGTLHGRRQGSMKLRQSPSENVPSFTSSHIAQDGVTVNMPRNGHRRWRPTPSRSLVTAVQVIDTALIMKVLEQEVKASPSASPSPLWTTKPETASRLRGRMEVILDWAESVAIAKVKIRLVGAATSTSCCHLALRCDGSGITPPFPM